MSEPDAQRARYGRLLAPALCTLTASLALAGDPAPPPFLSAGPERVAVTPSAGRRMALTYCQACHLFPEPEFLPKWSWKQHVLPRMESFVGLMQPDYPKYADADLMKASGVYPERPTVPAKEWQVAEDYYLSNAPDEPLPQDPRPEIELGLRHFRTEQPLFRIGPAGVTMVQVSTAGKKIYVGDDTTKALHILDGQGSRLDTVVFSNAPVAVHEAPEGLYVTSVGSVQPTEMKVADFRLLRWLSNGPPQMTFLRRELPRTTFAEFADFNGDRRTDVALCMFGDLTGRFAWLENTGPEQYREHEILAKAGSVRCRAHDLNGDGFTDLAVLMTQNHEELVAYLNDGKGQFTAHSILKRPPVWGHNFFDLVDFNGDGLLDLLITNGDNAEYPISPTKKFHGVRIFLNRGNLRFERAFFYPLNGAVKAVARDFDQDGDLDLAVISWFPDYRLSPRESFVYLENQGKLNFTATTFSECISGRWLALDAGDLDGDGDDDLVLGSYIRGPTPVPQFLMEAWQGTKLAVIILRNTLR